MTAMSLAVLLLSALIADLSPEELIERLNTPDRVVRLLDRHGLNVQAEWLADSGEEGVFLCQRG